MLGLSEVYTYKKIVYKMFFSEHEFVFLWDLHPKLRRLPRWKAHSIRNPTTYIIAQIGYFIAYPVIRMALIPDKRGILRVLSAKPIRQEPRFIQIGKAQAEIVHRERIALIWECYLFGDDEPKRLFGSLENGLKEAIRGLVQYLKERWNVERIYINGYEPTCPDLYPKILSSLGFKKEGESPSKFPIFMKKID